MDIIDYELIEKVSILVGSKIVLYGTGFWAEKTFACLKKIGNTPQFICQTKSCGEVFHGLEVKNISDILNKYDTDQYLLIIASVKYYEEMIEQCKETKKINICTLYGFYTSIKIHVGEHVLPREFEREIEAGLYIGQDFFSSKLKCYLVNQFVRAASEDIWIFQPGKVGSQTIWNSISNKSIQFHTLGVAYRFVDAEKKYLDYYLQLMHKKKIKIISAVREPISRDIAAFFQNSDLEYWPYHQYNCNVFSLYGNSINSKMIEDKEIKERCPIWRKSLNQAFEDLTNVIINHRQDVFSWFDYEINEIFGIDVYSYPFDQEKGYTIIEKENVQILLLKMEYLSGLEQVIGDFIGDPDYKLVNRNEALGKMYRYVYKKFKENVKISPNYFEYYYAENFKYKHFYSEKEIEASSQHWKKYVSKD